MFNGQRFEALPKPVVGTQARFYMHGIEGNPESMTRFINEADQWASTYNYEYRSMTDSCVVFKRVEG